MKVIAARPPTSTASAFYSGKAVREFAVRPLCKPAKPDGPKLKARTDKRTPQEIAEGQARAERRVDELKRARRGPLGWMG